MRNRERPRQGWPAFNPDDSSVAAKRRRRRSLRLGEVARSNAYLWGRNQPAYSSDCAHASERGDARIARPRWVSTRPTTGTSSMTALIFSSPAHSLGDLPNISSVKCSEVCLSGSRPSPTTADGRNLPQSTCARAQPSRKQAAGSACASGSSTVCAMRTAQHAQAPSRPQSPADGSRARLSIICSSARRVVATSAAPKPCSATALTCSASGTSTSCRRLPVGVRNT